MEGLAEQGDVELLALLVEPGSGPSGLTTAVRLQDRFGGLAGLARLGPALLRETAGLDEPGAMRLAAALELGRRVGVRASCRDHNQPVETPAAVAARVAPRAIGLDHERMWVLALDGGGRLRALRRVAQGGQHALRVSVPVILHAAIANAACGFVLAHNHPSGDPTPSEEDIELTHRVAAAADTVGVPLLDHVIVCASGEYASLLDLQLLVASGNYQA